MQKLLLHIILFSYVIVLFKPAFPYLKDAVNHLVFYKQHMATVHFENGKYHVHAEVAKNAAEDNSTKNIPTSKKENTATDHVFFINKINEDYIIKICKKYILPANNFLPEEDVEYNYPPPRI